MAMRINILNLEVSAMAATCRVWLLAVVALGFLGFCATGWASCITLLECCVLRIECLGERWSSVIGDLNTTAPLSVVYERVLCEENKW